MFKKLKQVSQTKVNLVLFILMIIVLTFGTGSILYAISLLNGVENMMRIVLAVTLFLIWLSIIVSCFNSMKKSKVKIKIAFIIVLIYSIFLGVVAFYILKTYSIIDSMTASATNYSTSLVTLTTNDVKDVKDIDDGKIGILSDTTNVVGNNLPLEIINNNNLKNEVLEYDNFMDLISALLDEEVMYIFLPTNYVTTFTEAEGVDFKSIGEDTKIIYTKTKKVENKVDSKKTTIDKPFTMLLMGVDSEEEDISSGSYLGDSLLLITFNPTTLNTTILSIPRDSYVPIACYSNQRKSKITHAAAYGVDCMVETIQNFTGITIDYHAVINFKGVVNLVDALGGIEVDIPYAFCEQNSSRKWGNSTIYVEEGLQILNGEKALAFSRNRHSWPDYCPKKYSNYLSNDFIRGQHQQTVLTAILNKMKTAKNINTITSLLDTISKSMETNMTVNEILSFYNIGKSILAKSNSTDTDVNDLISIQRLYLNGKDAYVLEGKSNIYVYDIYKASTSAVVEEMKINLGLIEPTVIKEFSFSIDNVYEENVIGQNVTGNSSLVRLPDFTGDSETQAKSTCSKLGITCSFKYVTTGSGEDNTVIAQSYATGYDVSYISSLTLTILEKKETSVNDNPTSTSSSVSNKSDSSASSDSSKTDDNESSEEGKLETDKEEDSE